MSVQRFGHPARQRDTIREARGRIGVAIQAVLRPRIPQRDLVVVRRDHLNLVQARIQLQNR